MKSKIIQLLQPFFRLLVAFYRIFPIQNKKIFLWTFNGEKPGDSPYYIMKKIIEDNDGYTFYWGVKRMESSPLNSSLHYIKKYSLRYFYHIATSKFWILNTRSERYFVKRRGQIYIQTWHSALRLKKIEADAEEYLDKKYIKNAKRDARMTDYMISGNGFSEATYRRAFYYSGKILKTGTPRIDVLLSDKEKNQAKETICDHYDIPKKKKIVLYAPTFRKNTPENEWVLDLKKLQENLGQDYVLIARAHPRTTIYIPEGVKNGTNYSSMQDLILACDILITDYSGCCFDAMYASKKCVLYTPDLEQYLQSERAVYLTANDLPFPTCKTLEELVTEIEKGKNPEYEKSIKKFMKEINSYEDGNASRNVYEIIRGENEKI